MLSRAIIPISRAGCKAVFLPLVCFGVSFYGALLGWFECQTHLTNFISFPSRRSWTRVTPLLLLGQCKLHGSPWREQGVIQDGVKMALQATGRFGGRVVG